MNDTLRQMVRGTYDLQKIRIATGNRIAMNYLSKLGQEPGKELDDEEAKKVLETIRAEYKRLTDGLVRLPTPMRFKGTSIISEWTELALIAQWIDYERHEKQHFRRLEHVLVDYPVYTKYLKNVTGVGPAMAGVLIAEIDIAKARYPSSLWKYAGLDVVNGKGRSRHKEHLVDVEYVARDGTTQTKKSITYNPFLKTKLMGVLAPSFLRCGNETYKKIYDDYKHRLEHKWPDATKFHRHKAALRYMMKMFLADYHTAWRSIEGLPTSNHYSEDKLDIKHRAA